MSNSIRPKALRRRLLRSRPVAATIRSMERAAKKREGHHLVVAMFHGTESAGRFGEQLDALLEGRVAVKGADVVEALAGRSALPSRAVWITFDDAYGNFHDVAWPVLEKRGVPATQFVPTGFVGSNPAQFWWDRLEAAIQHGRARSIDIPLADGGERKVALAARGKVWKLARHEIKRMPHALAMDAVERIIRDLDAPDGVVTERVMGWDEIRNLMARGLEVGGHTRAHPMLDQLTGKSAAEEVAAGFRDLEQNLGPVLPAFAYPSGQYNGYVMEAVRRCGISVAVTTKNGLNRVGSVDPMQLRRVPIGPKASEVAVRLRLLMAARSVA